MIFIFLCLCGVISEARILIQPNSEKDYGPITFDFQQFLYSKGLASYDYARFDLGKSGSFGGRGKLDPELYETAKPGKPGKIPVVFFHGNSDSALKSNDFSTGWTKTVEYFLSQGYEMDELYATSWGNTNTTAAVFRFHDCRTVIRLRKFVEAVFDYTGAREINIISHSMGVTLARKVIQGGWIQDENESCNIGKPMTNKIRAILGIAGANYGLCACIGHSESVVWPTCNSDNGLWPGETCVNANFEGLCAADPLPGPCNGLQYSKFLTDLNTIRYKPALNIFSMYSTEDELIDLRRSMGDILIGNGNLVWGRPTSEIPWSDGVKVYTNYTHMETKLNTTADQYHIITYLNIPKN
ncbi:unnamed protein product [Caenorhabditis angaria]|uniref:Uncharacterized protein n=1 Tax=Caenorhabditis angaria TaxID=860376 RepID=A0A9P1INF4_9PELO|nr:unnamed protein product [Caenorhabditis angaria]